MEEKGKEREREGWNRKGGWLTCNCTTSTCSFHPFLSVREACEHKGCFRGKKQFQYLAQKNFFFFRERGISILEYVLGTSRMGINWKTSYPRWKIIFMKLSRIILWEWTSSKRFLRSWSWRSRKMDKFQFCFQCLE